MKLATVQFTCCPTCQSALSLSIETESEIVENGNLFCTKCRQSYPILDGIPRFIDPQDLKGSNRRFARFYDRLAPFYSLFIKASLLPFGGDRKARKEILDRLEFTGGRLLEVSIGTGSNLPYLFESPETHEVVGVDISIGQLSQCQKLIYKQGWLVDLLQAGAENLPFMADTFDQVLHIGGINFFSDKKRAIGEMIRVIRPRGKIVIADEAEHLAKLIDRPSTPPHTGPDHGDAASSLIDLVPPTMEEKRLDGIWKMHGRFHGYCLVFRKPA
jgi:ubiquinone/menaquinone biosynthesis C-methylase UbiE